MRDLKQTWQTNWSKKLNRYVPVLAVAVVFGGLGTALLFSSHAATPTANLEAESGTVSSAASSVSDSSASGGGAVIFGQADRCPAYPAFPDANCTGVPSGTTLTAYTGPSTISTVGTVINAKTISTCLDITGTNVQIKNSLIQANCGQGALITGGTSGSVTVSDSELDGMDADGHETGIIGSNFTCNHCKVHDLGEGFNMDNNDTITNSYIYNLFGGGGSHNNAILSNGGANHTITHNNLYAVYVNTPTDPGTGISGALSLFGDFAVIQDILVQNNLFTTGGSYCTYGGSEPSKAFPNGNNIRYIDNKFSTIINAQCGGYGPVAYFSNTNTGDVWTGNVWADGPNVGQQISP